MALEMQLFLVTQLMDRVGKSRMLKCLALIALLTLPLTQAVAAPLTESQYWEKTQLPLGLFSQFISNAKCNSSPAYLRGCRAALKTAQVTAGKPADTEDATEFERAIGESESHIEGLMPIQMFRAKVLNTLLTSFDAHAEIRPSQMMDDTLKGSKQNYVGVGIELYPTAAALIVRGVAPKSPAQKAGVREDDLIVAVAKNGHGFEAIGNDLNRASDLILGANNTAVALRISRGRETLDLGMKRAPISVPYVTGEIKNGVGTLRITSFESYTVCSKALKQLSLLQSQGLQKLILDLRGNPGGNKGMAICVAELFTGPRKIVGTKGVMNMIPGLYEVMQIKASLLTEDMNWEGGYIASPKYSGPMVVLIDALSASGAEIVAGALQDYNRAWLIGERSSGKGTVQSEEFIPNHPSLTLKYTTERFYQPLGRTNQAVGITPSFEVTRRKDAALESVIRLREVDLYPGGLSPESPPWLETRPAEVARIRKCLEISQSVEANLNAFINSGQPADYQKAFAQSVLGCL